MSKQSKKRYICNHCGAVSLKWSGKCNDCNEWGGIIEEIQEKGDLVGNNKGYVLDLLFLCYQIIHVGHAYKPCFR